MNRPIEPLAAALARLEARWGSAAIRLGDGRPALLPVEGALAPAPLVIADAPPDPLAPADDRIVPTGFPALDAILGPGGLVRRAQVTLRGDASSGKTTLALRLVAEAQACGAIAAWLDLAHAFDPLEAVARGVDLAWLLVLRAPEATEGLRLAGALLGGRTVELLVADLPERMPLDRDALLRQLAARARQAGASLVVIEPADLAPALRGALSEVAGVGLDLERRAWIRSGRDVVGQWTQVTVVKNRFGPPGRRVDLEIRYADEGDRDRDVHRSLDAEMAPGVQSTTPGRPAHAGWTIDAGRPAHAGWPVVPLPAHPPAPRVLRARRVPSVPRVPPDPRGCRPPVRLRGSPAAPPPGIPAVSSSESTIVGSTHAIAPSRLAPSAAPARADVPPASRPGGPGRPSVGSRSGAGLQPLGAPPGRAAGDEPRGCTRARA